MKLSFAKDRPLDVIALGRIGIDMYANDVNCPLEEVSSFSQHIGGSPANIAMGSAKLGLKTGFIGRIAPDGFGRFIMKQFELQGIDTRGIVYDRTGATTQIAVSEILSPEKANIIFYRDNVADLNLSPLDISEDYIASAKILLLSGTALAGSPSREAVFVAIEYALKHDVRIMMDIDYRPFTWKSKEEMSVYYNLAAEKCDIILGTREEFDVIEGIVCPDNKDDRLSAARLFEKNAKIIVVKHGKEGSLGFSADGTSCRGEIYPVKVLNTFGAGDSYAASFISGLLDDCSVEECMKRGAASSSIVISRNDCSDSMPTREERDTFMATHQAVRG